MNFEALLATLIPILGEAGVAALTEQINALAANEDEAWKAMVLALVADAVKEHGVDGIVLAEEAIESLFKNEVPDIDWASPRVVSDLVAQMQNAEAGRKSQVRDYFTKIGDVLGILGVGIIKGLLAG